jgi:hypothetical protein
MRAQSVQIQSSAQEIMERVRRQSGRVDGMVTNVLDGIEHAGSFVVDVIGKPVRQVSAILASAKAVIESLRGSQASRRPNPSIGEDRFV